MPARPTVVALVVTVLVGVAISSVSADDRGHPATQAAMDMAVEQDGVPGVLGRAQDESGGWTGASGVADRRTERPRASRDRFRIGSLTKPFVAVVLLQLEAEHRIRLDDPVERWLPGEVRGRGNDGRRITVRQLLGHTSGVFDYTLDPGIQRAYTGTAFMSHRFSPHSPGGLVRTALGHPPDFAPGRGWHYSNTNYVLAGMIIQRVTGRPYGEEIERRVVRPLRLRDTSLPGRSPRIPRPSGRAYSTLFGTGGNKKNEKVYDVTAMNPSVAGASGEMVSSTGDLVRFFRALARGRLLPEREFAQMRRTVPAEGGEGYGLGLSERKLPCGVTVLGHEGTILGSRSVAVTTPDGAHAAAFNVNGDWAGDTRTMVDAEFCG
ncbi:serine hydrolase domain-containing protein [Streptomyces sp. ODS28]|uniref:serine hydrolase domain-containing protein n=1 Tax=Streptomyces sp. ODS28 TaxID=3136688 RepID=UPI0031EE54A7